MKHDPNHKGNVAELAFAAEAARLELSVLKPLTEHEPYDLVLGIAGRLLRVQCKWATRKGNVICVRLKRSRHTPTRGYVVNTYRRDEIDAFGIYCGDLDRCYLVPIERAEGAQGIDLRLTPTKNNQRAALNWASDYELPGAVAQLAERFAGSEEARGSNPLSSTLQAEKCPPVEVVGAHEFRNHFGYYLEHAMAGGEVRVNRRGRPHVRLCPAVGRGSARRLPLRRPSDLP
jgi:prevent-host-death family protein